MANRPLLEKGARIAAVPVASPAFSPRAIERGVDKLRRLGYDVVLHPGCFERHGYLAGTDIDRAEAFASAYVDTSVDAVWAVQGGYGCFRLLEQLPFEALRQARRKPVFGFSDVTALHLGLWRALGPLPLIYAPVIGTLADATEPTMRALTAVLDGSPYDIEMPTDVPELDVIQEGVAAGPLMGGCLTLLAASLGTPWEIETEGCILFLEDVGEEPYRIDAYLTQLRLGGKLRGVRAVVVGELAQCGPREFRPSYGDVGSLSLDAVLRDRLGDLGVPVVCGYPIGHGRHQIALPYGRQAVVRGDRVSVCAP